MRIRRPVAGLFIALTLFGGGGATLVGCGDPVDSETGTSKDTASNTAGDSSNTSGATNSSSSLPVPDNSNRESTAPTDQDQPANGG
jgi:hypothetical protein